MSDASLEERLAAVERALTEGDGSAPDLSAPDRDVVERVETLEEDVAELEAAVQAVRGYVGSVKHVNDEVEQRADAAMAKAEAVERALADGEDAAGVASDRRTTGGSPGCADERRGSRSISGATRDRSESWSSERAERAVPNPGHGRFDDRGTRRRGDRCDEAGEDPQQSVADRDTDRRQPIEPDRGRVGHQRLEGSDEEDGLLARLMGVL